MLPYGPATSRKGISRLALLMRKAPGIAVLCETVRLLTTTPILFNYPQGDSNPCRQDENLVTSSVSAAPTTPSDAIGSCEAQCEAPNSGIDPGLAVIVDAWPHLTDDQRARVMAIIEGGEANQ